MRVQDRVATNSREHWVLFALVEHEDAHPGEYVDAPSLHERTGERFPDAEWIHETLVELVTRGLVETKPQGFRPTSPGSVCVNHLGKPDAPAWAHPTPPSLAEDEGDEGLAVPEKNLIPDFPWNEATEARVYWAEDASERLGDSRMVETAATLVERLPGEYSVVLTVGPWRPYDCAYAVNVERELVRLDYYSVRPGATRWHEHLVHAVHQGVLEDQKWRVDESPGGAA